MTIEEYIVLQSPEVQPLLRQVWTCIREAIPDAEATGWRQENSRITMSKPTNKQEFVASIMEGYSKLNEQIDKLTPEA